MPTPTSVISLCGVISAATMAKAADDGSLGTITSAARSVASPASAT